MDPLSDVLGDLRADAVVTGRFTFGAPWSLRKPALEHREALEQAIDRSLPALDALLQGDMEAAMRLIHAKPQRPKPPRPDAPAAA